MSRVQRRDAKNADFAQGTRTGFSAPPQRALRLCAEFLSRPSARLFAKYLLCGVFALATLSCGAAHSNKERDLSDPAEAELIEDSGARLSGSFALRSEEDDYAKKSSQAELKTTFRFSEDGSFSIERELRDAGPSIEEGTYVISKQGELVLYIEKIGGDPRSDARVARYQINGQTQNTLNLQRNPSSALVLEKR